jgi:hypothetical protein
MAVFVFRELKIKIVIGFKHDIFLGSKPFEKRLNFLYSDSDTKVENVYI